MRSPDRPDRRRVWVLSFLAIALVGAAWALVVPTGGQPDESAHIAKAAAVVRGEITWDDRIDFVSTDRQTLTHSDITFQAPTGYANLVYRSLCISHRPYESADCAPPIDNSDVPVSTPSNYTAAYPPLPYFLMGWPSLFLPATKGVYAMRLCMVALCAALLATAFTVARSHRNPRYFILGTALATTPMVLFLQSAPNPNAFEITASICFLVCLSQLFSGSGPGPRDRFVLVSATVSACALALARPVSFGIVVYALLACLITFGNRENLRSLAAWRGVRVAILAAILAMVGAVSWFLYADPLNTIVGRPWLEGDLSDHIVYSLQQLPIRLREMVGLYGWGDTQPPSWVHTGWFVLVIALVLTALAVGTWRHRISLFGLVCAMGIIPTIAELPRVDELGFIWFGRYSLAFVVAVPVLAGAIIAAAAPRRLPRFAAHPWILTPVAAFAGACLFASISTLLSRFSTGHPERMLSYLDRNAPWVPQFGATGALVLITAASLGYAVWLAWMLRAPQRVEIDPHAAPEPDEPQLALADTMPSS